MKNLSITYLLILLVYSPMGFALGGKGYNHVSHAYQWDSGVHSSIQGVNGNIDGTEFKRGIVANRFDTRHHGGRKRDILTHVQFGFADLSVWARMFLPSIVALPSAGYRVKIGIWQVEEGGFPSEKNLIYTQNYRIHSRDLGAGDLGNGEFYPPINVNGTRNGSNLRPDNCVVQALPCNHTRRLDNTPTGGLNNTLQGTFSLYGTLFTTIKLKREVEVRKEFFVGILVDVPGAPPGVQYVTNLIASSVVDANLPRYQGTGLINNVPTDISLQPIQYVLENFQPVGGLSLLTYLDEVFAIRALSKP